MTIVITALLNFLCEEEIHISDKVKAEDDDIHFPGASVEGIYTSKSGFEWSSKLRQHTRRLTHIVNAKPGLQNHR